MIFLAAEKFSSQRLLKDHLKVAMLTVKAAPHEWVTRTGQP